MRSVLARSFSGTAARSAGVTSTFTPDPEKEKSGFRTQRSRSSGDRSRSLSSRASGTSGCRSPGSACLLQRKNQFGWPAHCDVQLVREAEGQIGPSSRRARPRSSGCRRGGRGSSGRPARTTARARASRGRSGRPPGCRRASRWPRSPGRCPAPAGRGRAGRRSRREGRPGSRLADHAQVARVVEAAQEEVEPLAVHHLEAQPPLQELEGVERGEALQLDEPGREAGPPPRRPRSRPGRRAGGRRSPGRRTPPAPRPSSARGPRAAGARSRSRAPPRTIASRSSGGRKTGDSQMRNPIRDPAAWARRAL